MIKHIVMWKLHNEANGNNKVINALLIKEKLESLSGKIHGMNQIEVGINYNATPEGVDLVLYSEFESKQALEDYQIHPEHVKMMEFIKSCRYERRVADYEI